MMLKVKIQVKVKKDIENLTEIHVDCTTEVILSSHSKHRVKKLLMGSRILSMEMKVMILPSKND